MLRSMLDTNVCIRVLRDRPKHAGERFKHEAGTLAISTIVLYELLFGASNSDRPDHHRGLINDLQSRVMTMPFDERASDHAADIRRDLASRGELIGPNDLLIAGHARSLGLRLVTGSLREFRRVEGLRCEDWLNETGAAQ